MAKQEIDRYTFRAPGQATSYFCGYQRLMELRTDVERALGKRFDRQNYHDFVLAQGLKGESDQKSLERAIGLYRRIKAEIPDDPHAYQAEDSLSDILRLMPGVRMPQGTG